MSGAITRQFGLKPFWGLSQNTPPSHQQRQHWLSEQVLSWSGLPVVTIRPTMFLESLFPLTGASGLK